jgi:hypothetical protein
MRCWFSLIALLNTHISFCWNGEITPTYHKLYLCILKCRVARACACVCVCLFVGYLGNGLSEQVPSPFQCCFKFVFTFYQCKILLTLVYGISELIQQTFIAIFFPVLFFWRNELVISNVRKYFWQFSEIFSALRFDAFSAVTVQYALHYSCHNITTRIGTSWFRRY